MTSVNSKRIAKNTLLLYIRMAIAMLVSLYTSRVILEALGFSDFGIYDVVGGIVAVFSVINSALASSTARYISIELGKENSNRVNVVFSATALLHILLALVIIVASETIGVWFLNNCLNIPHNRVIAANWLLQFSIITAAVNITQIPYTAAMIAHEKMSIFAYVGLFTSFANLAVAFLIKYAPFDRLIWYGFLVLAVNVASMFLSRYLCIKQFPECKITKTYDKPLYKEILFYTGYSLLSQISWMVQNQGVAFLLNVFFGSVINAAQAIGLRLLNVLRQLYRSFATSIQPSLYKLYISEDWNALIQLTIRGSLISYFLGLVLAVPLIVFSDTILTFWLGDYPIYTTGIVICCIIQELINIIGNTREKLFEAANRVKQYSLMNGIILLLSFPIIWIYLIMGFSPISAFIIILVSRVITDIASLILIGHYIPHFLCLNFLLRVHVPCICITSVTILLGLAIKALVLDKLIALSITTILSTAVIVIAIWCIALTKNQKQSVLSKFKR